MMTSVLLFFVLGLFVIPFHSFAKLLSTASRESTRRQLQGVKINCCTVTHKPTVFRNSNKKYGLEGIAIDYLIQLEERLGFSCRLMQIKEPSEISYNELIMNISACPPSADPTICKCDFIVGTWFQTTARHGKVRFLPPYTLGETSVYVNKVATRGSNRGIFFMTSFSPLIWGNVLFLTVVFVFLWMLIPRFQPETDQPNPIEDTAGLFRKVVHFLLKNKPLRRLRMATQSVWESMLNFGPSNAHMIGNSTRHWVLRFIIVLCGLFLVLVFESAMTAALVQEKLGTKYRTIDDFRDCRINASEVCIPKGGTIELKWNNSIALSKCSKGHPLPPQFIDTYEQAVKDVVENKCKYLVTDSQSGDHAASGQHCGEILKVGQPLYWGGGSSLVRNDFKYYDEFATATLDMLMDGVRISIDDYIHKRGPCELPKSSTLDWRQLKGFFIMAYTACALLLVAMTVVPEHVHDENIIEARSHDGEQKTASKEIV